jgi:hypothetical protein
MVGAAPARVAGAIVDTPAVCEGAMAVKGCPYFEVVFLSTDHSCELCAVRARPHEREAKRARIVLRRRALLGRFAGVDGVPEGRGQPQRS